MAWWNGILQKAIYTTIEPQVIEISRPLCVGPIGTR